VKLTYANYAGALATAGNLVFLGHIDGTFSAYDAKTLNELWSFDVGTGINAPPISYSVNGKQYIAVLVGSRQPTNIIPLFARTQEHLNGFHAVRIQPIATNRRDHGIAPTGKDRTRRRA
jgi:outer membrane protein assembly factor BamB